MRVSLLLQRPVGYVRHENSASWGIATASYTASMKMLLEWLSGSDIGRHTLAEKVDLDAVFVVLGSPSPMERSSSKL